MEIVYKDKCETISLGDTKAGTCFKFGDCESEDLFIKIYNSDSTCSLVLNLNTNLTDSYSTLRKVYPMKVELHVLGKEVITNG